MAEYIQKGESLDYTNGTDYSIAAGDIVEIGGLIGVAGCTIAPGQTGALHVVGVFKTKKTGTAAVAMGQTVYYDGTGITDEADDGEDTPTAYTKAGYAAAPAAADDKEILVKLNG